MGEANERGRSRGLENLSLEAYPRDLLQRFMCDSDARNAAFREEEVELNLGLSLGGRFGVDKTAKEKKVVRSSSIIGTVSFVRHGERHGGGGDDSALLVPAAEHLVLVRTSSLPTETEEEWRKRKELQTLRRMAAKR